MKKTKIRELYEVTYKNHNNFIEFIAKEGYMIAIDDDTYCKSVMMPLSGDYNIKTITEEEYNDILEEQEKEEA